MGNSSTKTKRLGVTALVVAVVALLASVLSLGFHLGSWVTERNARSAGFSSPYRWDGIFLRIPLGWQQERISANVMRLESIDENATIEVAYFESTDDPLALSEGELVAASKEFLTQISDDFIRSNNAHRWPMYLASKGHKTDSGHRARYRIALFVPGKKILIKANLPNVVSNVDPSAGKPGSKYARLIGEFVDAITTVEDAAPSPSS